MQNHYFLVLNDGANQSRNLRKKSTNFLGKINFGSTRKKDKEICVIWSIYRGDNRIIIPSEYITKTLILSDSYGRGILARENLTLVGFLESSFEIFFPIFLVEI